MNRFLRLLFPAPPSPVAASALILAARIIFGMFFLSHGIDKLMAFSALAISFPDPLGIGSTLSLVSIIFAEVVCSLCIIFGVLFRLALLPMIFAMCVALIAIHGNAPFVVREPALIYLSIFVLLLLSGAGYFSIDTMIRNRMPHAPSDDE
ncbi:MAG: DoxX family protein [Bacteroidaceae bacterium]|nr:DoxX family protein [Bacteroidaceae bacterium]